MFNQNGPTRSNRAATPAESSEATAAQISASIKKEYHDFVADIEDLVKATTHLTGDELKLARQQLEERMLTAKQSLQGLGDTLSERARHSAHITNDYVHQQPWQAMGLVAVSSFLLGLVVSRRH